jgi:hypothetical protein
MTPQETQRLREALESIIGACGSIKGIAEAALAVPEATPALPALDDEAAWKTCPQCKRTNSVATWEKFSGKCPNCNDLFEKEQYYATGYTREELKGMHPTVELRGALERIKKIANGEELTEFDDTAQLNKVGGIADDALAAPEATPGGTQRLRELDSIIREAQRLFAKGTVGEQQITHPLQEFRAALAAPEATETLLNQRLFDLVRYKRSELHEDGLITDEEYATLAQEHGAVKRLEDYDAALAAIRAAAPAPEAKTERYRCTFCDGEHLEQECPNKCTPAQAAPEATR